MGYPKNSKPPTQTTSDPLAEKVLLYQHFWCAALSSGTAWCAGVGYEMLRCRDQGNPLWESVICCRSAYSSLGFPMWKCWFFKNLSCRCTHHIHVCIYLYIYIAYINICYCLIILLYHYIIILLYYYIMILLYYYIMILLYYIILYYILLYYFIIIFYYNIIIL